MTGKNVLYIVPSWFTLYYHLDGHLKYLRDNGFRVGVVSEEVPRSLEAIAREGAVHYPPDIHIRVSIFADLKIVFRLIGIARRDRYDIFYAATRKAAILGAVARMCASA